MNKQQLLDNLTDLFTLAMASRDKRADNVDDLFVKAASIRDAINEFVPPALDIMSRAYLLPNETVAEGIKRIQNLVIDEMLGTSEKRMFRYGKVVTVGLPNGETILTILQEKKARAEAGSSGYINKNGVHVSNPCGEIDSQGRNLDLAGREIRQGEKYEECFARLHSQGVDIMSPYSRFKYPDPKDQRSVDVKSCPSSGESKSSPNPAPSSGNSTFISNDLSSRELQEGD